MSFFTFAIFDTPQSLPPTWFDPMILPGILTFFGAVIFVFGRLNEVQQNKDGFFKWVGVLLLGLALFLGFEKVVWLRDPLYSGLASEVGRRLVLAHWAAMAVPLLTLGGCLAWYMLERRKSLIR